MWGQHPRPPHVCACQWHLRGTPTNTSRSVLKGTAWRQSNLGAKDGLVLVEFLPQEGDCCQYMKTSPRASFHTTNPLMSPACTAPASSEREPLPWQDVCPKHHDRASKFACPAGWDWTAGGTQRPGLSPRPPRDALWSFLRWSVLSPQGDRGPLPAPAQTLGQGGGDTGDNAHKS